MYSLHLALMYMLSFIAAQTLQCQVEIPLARDPKGVERSCRPFAKRPELDKKIRGEVFGTGQSPLRRAVKLLKRDLKTNDLLKKAWMLGVTSRPDLRKDPTQLAAYVYSTKEPYFLFNSFNDAIASFCDDSSYEDFPYKGFYALLILLSQPREHDLYRGVDATVWAEKDMFVRFHRFVSASTNVTAAMNYALKNGGPGTLFVLKGVKEAAHINPFSQVPEEEEYLIEPDTQFKVVDITDGPISASNPGRAIVAERIIYDGDNSTFLLAM